MGCGCSSVAASDTEPPRCRKNAIFYEKDFREIDRRSTKVSSKYLKKTFQRLVRHLTRDTLSDLEKLRALFVWATSTDIQQLAETVTDEPKPDSPLDYLLKIHLKMGNHAHLFYKLCKCAAIPCVIITGVNKNASYHPGSRVNQRELLAQWNAVYVDGDWRLLDVLWASVCLLGASDPQWVLVNVDEIEAQNENRGKLQRFINEFFFLTDPDMMAGTHFPDDQQWQLLPRPVSLRKFEGFFYVRERFFELDLQITPLTRRHCVLVTKGGEITLGFGLSKGRGALYQFQYLFYSLNETKKFDNDIPLKQFVMNQKSPGTLSYNIRFPLTGFFRIDIFGQDREKHSTFDLVCSYVINCLEAKDQCQPLPDSPDIGWGPTWEMEEAGLAAQSNNEAVILSQDGTCDVLFTTEKDLEVKFALKHNSYDDWLLQKHAYAFKNEIGVGIKCRLPGVGEYALKVYVSSKGAFSSKPRNVCNYLIRVLNVDAASGRAFPDIKGGVLGKTGLADYFDVVAVSHKQAYVTSETNKITLVKSSAPGVELLGELTNIESDSKILCKQVIRLHNASNTTFEIDLPKDGEYALNIYASVQNSPCLHLVYTYLISYTMVKRDTPEDMSQSLSDSKASHVDENDELEELGPPPMLVPIFATTSRDHVTVKVATRLHNMAGVLDCRHIQETEPQENITLEKGEVDSSFHMSLPQYGEYDLSLFEEFPPGMLSQIANYEILRDEHAGQDMMEISEDISEKDKNDIQWLRYRDSKEKGLRRQLKVAIQSRNKRLLQATLAEWEELGLGDIDGELAKGKDVLELLKLIDALGKAMSSRDSGRLHRVLQRIEELGFSRELAVQVMTARRLLDYLKKLDRLRRLDRARSDILNLDQTTIAEIKSYSHPPVAVHLVMLSTCILMGMDEDYMQDWRSVQILISKTGKESLQRRVLEYDVQSLPIQTALRAKNVLSTLLLDDVVAVSAGAATFYVWATGIIEEAEVKFEDDGGDLSSVSLGPKSKGNITNLFQAYYATKTHPLKQVDEVDLDPSLNVTMPFLASEASKMSLRIESTNGTPVSSAPASRDSIRVNDVENSWENVPSNIYD